MEKTNPDCDMTVMMTSWKDAPPIEEKRRAVLQFIDHAEQPPFPLDSPQIVIGRSQHADLCVNDTYMSGRHARINVIHNFYYLEDLDSRNGTTVNGTPIKFLRLAHQDTITIGKTPFQFLQIDGVDSNYLKKLNLQAIEALAQALEAKNPYTKGHSERVADLAGQLAAAMGLAGSQIERIRIAGLLHDIGKIGVPETVLLKPGRLDDGEFAQIKKHPVQGKSILQPISFLEDILPAVYHHHERFDGKGYPAGLVSEAIPLWARILQVADTYDAMTSERPYRNALSRDQAAQEIIRYSGQQFDPAVVAAMVDIFAQAEAKGG
jgi:putative nucleotidyltransferase with HDIG domain